MMGRRGFLAAWMPPAVLLGLEGMGTRSLGQMHKDEVSIVHTRVFAAGPGGGNPCPVVPAADGLADEQMQSLARRFGLDTAFILRPQAENADIRVRYFVPDHEMGVSGHATIAAVTVKLLDKTFQPGTLKIETSTGLFEASWTRHGSSCLVTLEQNAPVFGSTVEPEAVARVLKIDPNQIAIAQSPIQLVSVSRAKLLVPLQDWRVLECLTPDFEALWRLCDAQRATGLYPFTRRTNKRNVEAETRQFPLRAGFPEDAATGVAAAALGAYLARYDLACLAGHHEFRIAQGYAMQTPSLIEVIADCADGMVNRTAIRGIADIVRHQRIRLDRDM